jgi:hypothetical protein
MDSPRTPRVRDGKKTRASQFFPAERLMLRGLRRSCSRRCRRWCRRPRDERTSNACATSPRGSWRYSGFPDRTPPLPSPSLGLGLPWSCFRLDVKGVASGCLPLPRGQDEKSSHGSAAQSCCRFHVEPLAGDASECAGSACSERAEPASRRAAPSHAQPRSGEQAADCTSGERGTTGQFNIEGRVLSWTGQSDPVNISFVLVVPV